MKIAVTSQNFRTITGHAGKTRRFLVYEVDESGVASEVQRLDLPKEMSLHEYHGDDHPVFTQDALITGGCGENLRNRMQAHGVRVVTTSTMDPLDAVQRFSRNEELPPAAPHDHTHASAPALISTDSITGKRN
jgi:predicted Fe-Mo cluster-binding NifX family protein